MKSFLVARNFTTAFASALFGFLTISSAHAELLNFDFSIVGDPTIFDPSTTYLSGTVTGELIGLENNASSQPTDIILFSAPAGLGVPNGLPYDLKANGWNLSEGGTLTVTNGIVTSALNYFPSSSNPPNYLYLNVSINDLTPNVGALNGIDFNNKAVANLNGFAGVSYTPLAVPEPASWMIGCVAALGFCGVRVWRRRSAR